MQQDYLLLNAVEFGGVPTAKVMFGGVIDPTSTLEEDSELRLDLGDSVRLGFLSLAGLRGDTLGLCICS